MAATAVAGGFDGEDEPGEGDADPDRIASIWTPLINWPEFWNRDHSVEDWIAWPLIPTGRQTALYAPAKSAKSFLALAVTAAVATGRDILGQRNTVGPQHVLYLDYEMTEDDLHERLEELGYGPEDDLSFLHYALLPSLPPLNTDEGAAAVLGLASAVSAVVVVVDTTGRAVWGEENTNDTYRDFAQTTGYVLKQAGIAVLRTDHAGKNKDQGQRGASAKNDDVDVVMRVETVEDGLTLTRTHTRIRWVPASVQIARRIVGDVTTYVAEHGGRPYAEGTKDLVALLRSLGIDADSSRRNAADALRDAGHKARNNRVGDALRWMREETPAFPSSLQKSGTTPGTSGFRTCGTGAGTGDGDMPSEQVGDGPGTIGNHTPRQLGAHPPPYKGGGLPSLTLELPQEPSEEELAAYHDAFGDDEPYPC